jgi:hypothetical protein
MSPPSFRPAVTLDATFIEPPRPGASMPPVRISACG